MKVFVVKKNADFTEGRGPMLFNRIFSTFEAAEKYVLAQDGIYGSKQGKSAYGGYNGYDIEEHEVLDGWDAEDEIRKGQELKELEERVTRLRMELR